MTQLSSGVAGLRRRFHRRNPPGSAPGVLSTESTAQHTRIRVMAYSRSELHEAEIDDVHELARLMQTWPMLWIDVDGLGDLDRVRQLSELIDVHPLALEDAVSVHERPKVERYPTHDFIVVRMISLGERIASEQLSLILRHGVVVTFQGELPGDSLEPVRRRLRAGQGRIRRR